MKNKLHTEYFKLNRGFTLLEIMLVVSIIGLLTVLAIPAFMKHRLRIENITFIEQQRVLMATFERIAITEGNYPPDAAKATEPAHFSEYTPRNVHWDKKTPIGGYWDWEHDNLNVGLVVSSPNRTTLQMKKIDKKIDDGDISSGLFRLHDKGYIYLSEE